MTERTAAETERTGEGQTLGEVGRTAYLSTRASLKYRVGFDTCEERSWQAAAEAIKAALIPCTFPPCLSAQTAATAGEEIARLRGEVDRTKCALENSKTAHKALATDALRALAGKVCTPEEGYVKAAHCLRGDIEELGKAAYQRGVEDERERAARVCEQYVFELTNESSFNRGKLRAAEELAEAIRASFPAPQKNTAECQEVCRWDMEDHSELRGLYQTDCGYALEDKLPEYFDKTVCPRCGRRVKVYG